MDKRQAEATLFHNGSRPVCPHVHRGKVLAYINSIVRDLADLHGRRTLNNSMKSLQVGLGFMKESSLHQHETTACSEFLKLASPINPNYPPE